MRHWFAREYGDTVRHSWMRERPEDRSLFSRLRPTLTVLAVTVFVLSLGAWDIALELRQVDEELRSSLVAWARATSAFFQDYDFKAFRGLPSDAQFEAFERLQKDLTMVQQSRRDLRFVYLVGLRGDEPFIYCDSEPENSPEKSPPGDKYTELPAEAKAMFETGSAIVHGPFEDRWGRWVSVFVKLPSRGSDTPPVLFAADVRAKHWNREVIRNSLPEISMVIVFLILVLGGGWVIHIVRRKTELLTCSEQAFHDLTTGISDRLWETDARMNYVYCSARVHEILGYTPEEVIGKNMLDFASEDEKPRMSAFLADLAQSQRPFRHYEHWDRHKDGRYVCLLTSGTPEFDSAGHLLGYRGIDTDVTEQKSIEQSLAKRDRLLEAAAEAANHLLADTQYTTGVRAALGALGTAIEADRAYLCEILRGDSTDTHTPVVWNAWSGNLLADTPAEAEPPVLPGRHVIPRWYDTLSTGLPVAGCVRDMPEIEQLLLGARNTKSVLVVPITILREFWGFACFEDCHSEREWNLGEIMILLSSASAIGTTVVRKQTEDGLVESNAWLSGTLRATRDMAVIMTDPSGIITKFSVGAERMFGYVASEVTGRFPLLAFHIDSEVRDACLSEGVALSLPNEGFRPFVELVRRYEVWEHEWTYVTKKGQRVRAVTSICEARDAAGELRGYVVAIRSLEKA